MFMTTNMFIAYLLWESKFKIKKMSKHKVVHIILMLNNRIIRINK